jgi:DNA-binding CsgD family transcriptional regulator
MGMSRIGDLKEALASWTPGEPPAATWFLPELRELLRAQFAGAYRPAATGAGWSLEFMYGVGERAAKHVRVFRQFVTGLPRSETFLTMSNPHFVDVKQRDRVMSMRDVARLDPRGGIPEPASGLFRTLGIAGHDQLRVLVCDGPSQLAWVGATREEPFTEREAALLSRLRAPLRARLRLERQLANPSLLAATLDATLEALPAAAFVIGPGRSIQIANRAGLILLESGKTRVLDSIRESEQKGRDAGGFSLTRIGTPGYPTYLLAIQRERGGIGERVVMAQTKWGLSVRQTRVLELVATGASNKEIATTLGCAEATVENHLTELFRRSGARSRAGLVGRLLIR